MLEMVDDRERERERMKEKLKIIQTKICERKGRENIENNRK